MKIAALLEREAQATRMVSEMARRICQPAILALALASILFGPVPQVSANHYPQPQTALLVSASRDQVQGAAGTSATVDFATSITVPEAVSMLQGHGARVVELYFDYWAGSSRRGGGFFVDAGAVPTQVAASFSAAVDAMLVDEIANQSKLTTLRPADGGLALAAPDQTHIAFADWVPDTVYTTVLDSSVSGYRYVQQVFIWNAGRTLTFDSNQGFEAQFYLDNSDGFTYLEHKDLQGFPIGAIWDSNMPGKYLATDAGDPANQMGYTVGTYDAPLLTTGVWYNTYVRTPNGNASSDWGEIQPQQTTETVGGCQSTQPTQWSNETGTPARVLEFYVAHSGDAFRPGFYVTELKAWP